jgi:hypothetical protein
MVTKVGKFTFAIPEGHAEEGKKVEKPFEYPQVENESEAATVMESKKWKLLGMVNEALRRNARSNAYQNALLPYKPSEVPEENIVERMVRDYIRLGASEEKARAAVAKVLAEMEETAGVEDAE